MVKLELPSLEDLSTLVSRGGAPNVACMILADAKKLAELGKEHYHDWEGLYLLYKEDGSSFALQWRFEHFSAAACGLGGRKVTEGQASPIGMAVLAQMYMLALLDGEPLQDIDPEDNKLFKSIRGTLSAEGGRKGGTEAQEQRADADREVFQPSGWSPVYGGGGFIVSWLDKSNAKKTLKKGQEASLLEGESTVLVFVNYKMEYASAQVPPLCCSSGLGVKA